MNKLYTALAITLATSCAYGAPEFLDQVNYVRGKAGFSDAFLSADGWSREPLAAYFNFPTKMLLDLFPEPVAELSVTAELDGVAIGCRNINWWKKDLLEEFPAKIKTALELHGHDPRFAKYVATIETVCYKGTLPLIDLFENMNIPLESIAHHLGLMVLKQYAGHGIATRMQVETIQMLREKGIRAIVTTTTNRLSARVMEKNGFVRFKDFSYADLGIPEISDTFSIWYLILS
jgi:GNAT superfamily N-acetyltransferase